MVSRVLLALAASVLAAGARAGDCPNPGALGTARTIEIGGAPAVGLKSYPRTLDLADHEVVLTFDDGPSPATTPAVLDALRAECVLATFFLIGRNAAAHPALVRRELAEGHTLGHHTWDHPAVTLRGLDPAAAVADIDRGMEADDRAAYGAYAGRPRVPFFRFPGFGDTPALLETLKGRGVAVFGTDVWASDWVSMTPEAELSLLMARLRAAGRGIVLLHDIKRQTAEMLPRFLAALKAEGFHVVRIVPGAAAAPLREAPPGWTSETERTLAHLRPRGASALRAAARPAPAAPGTSPEPARLRGAVD